MAPRSYLASLLAVAVLAACGGDDADDQAFCDDLTDVNSQLAAVDPADADRLDEMVATLENLDPPDEIEDAYNNVADLYTEIAEDDIPLSDPDLATDFANLQTDIQTIDDYTIEHCGTGGE